jgi:fatty-acyl-CoA synthase
VLFHALNMAATSRFAEPDGHHLNLLPLFWAGGLNTFTSPMFYRGGRVTTTRRFDESVMLSLLTDPGLAVTHICAAPEMYFRVAALPEFARATFATLRRALTGGWRPDTPRLHALWRARSVHPAGLRSNGTSYVRATPGCSGPRRAGRWPDAGPARAGLGRISG